MTDVKSVEMLNRFEHLLYDNCGRVLFYILVLLHIVKKIHSVTKLHNYVEVVFVHIDFVEVDYVWMIQSL